MLNEKCFNTLCEGEIDDQHPVHGTQLDAARGLIQTKRFRPSASMRRAQMSIATTTIRSTDLLNIMSSPESMLIRQG